MTWQLLKSIYPGFSDEAYKAAVPYWKASFTRDIVLDILKEQEGRIEQGKVSPGSPPPADSGSAKDSIQVYRDPETGILLYRSIVTDPTTLNTYWSEARPVPSSSLPPAPGEDTLVKIIQEGGYDIAIYQPPVGDPYRRPLGKSDIDRLSQRDIADLGLAQSQLARLLANDAEETRRFEATLLASQEEKKQARELALAQLAYQEKRDAADRAAADARAIGDYERQRMATAQAGYEGLTAAMSQAGQELAQRWAQPTVLSPEYNQPVNWIEKWKAMNTPAPVTPVGLGVASSAAEAAQMGLSRWITPDQAAAAGLNASGMWGAGGWQSTADPQWLDEGIGTIMEPDARAALLNQSRIAEGNRIVADLLESGGTMAVPDTSWQRQTGPITPQWAQGALINQQAGQPLNLGKLKRTGIRPVSQQQWSRMLPSMREGLQGLARAADQDWGDYTANMATMWGASRPEQQAKRRAFAFA